MNPSDTDYGQPIVPDGSAKVRLAEFGMPTAFQLGIRRFGFAYYAELQEAAKAMRYWTSGGPDLYRGSRPKADPCDVLPSIVLGAMERATGFVEVQPNFLPMEETQRSGPGVTLKDRIRDALCDMVEAQADSLITGEGLCFCVDGAWSERVIARTTNRILAMMQEEK